MHEVVIVAAARTAIGTFQGALADTSAVEIRDAGGSGDSLWGFAVAMRRW